MATVPTPIVTIEDVYRQGEKIIRLLENGTSAPQVTQPTTPMTLKAAAEAAEADPQLRVEVNFPKRLLVFIRKGGMAGMGESRFTRPLEF